MNLFFFGTLMDEDVRTIVCGKRLDRVEPAIAQGFRRVFVAGRHYPMLLPRPCGWVQGLLVRDVDGDSLHRLQVYEGWEYDLKPIAVRLGDGEQVMASVFLCPPHIQPDKRPWDLEQWRRRHKRAFLPKAQGLMDAAQRGALRPLGASLQPARQSRRSPLRQG